MTNPPVITLTTDFGHHDPYVGIMKGVILSICPTARIVDLCHEVPPFNVDQGAFLVSQSLGFFPPGTIHVVVVDPGVGGPRRALVAQGRSAFFVGPDNGVLAPLLEADGQLVAHQIGVPDFLPARRSATFHGRDVFAPAAAHLAMGKAPAAFGPRITDNLARPLPGAAQVTEGWRGMVLHIDRFGNLVTSLPEELVDRIRSVTLGHHTVYRARHYGDVLPGVAAFIPGSSGRIEVFVRDGSAAELLGAHVGGPVTAQQVTAA
ncbi:MAG: SAM-dependent chlorinase/fluorinase [Nitrospirota bacterium]|nr:SAM-dependent chlorinase/fluorinase [Nitrospirota bacterium]